jgi:lipoprotein NlpI
MDAAISDHSRAIALSPEWAPAYEGRGVAYIGKHAYERAREDLSRAIELVPSRPSVRYRRAIAYWLMGDDATASADLDEAVRLGPGQVWPRVWRGYYQLVAGNNELAEADMRNAVDTSTPKDMRSVLQGMCIVLLRRGKKDAAIALLNDNMVRRGEALNSWDRASLRYLVGELSEKDLYACAQRDDKDETKTTVREKTHAAHFLVAMKAFVGGDMNRATQWFRKCVETDVRHCIGHVISQAWLARHGSRR